MKPRLVCLVSILVFVSLACNLPVTGMSGSATLTPTGSPVFLTHVAETVQALNTPEPLIEVPTPALPTVTPPAIATATDTPVPPTETAQPCDQAAFVKDVTIPDGTKMMPGEAFTKTWRLKNTGTCTWSTSYALVFAGGDAMGAPAVINLPSSVAPNAVVDLSVNLKAPAQPGKYTGNWKLRNATGGVFSPGGNQPFFVQIEVVAPTPTLTLTSLPTPTLTLTPTPTPSSTPSLTTNAVLIYEFSANVCQAEWRSQSGVLDCPGVSGDKKGYVLTPQNPKLESGQVESSPVLLTGPDNATDGAITGRYPALTIQQGYHFRASLACLSGAVQCSVIYQLNFMIGSGEPANLGQWKHTYGSGVMPVDVDLSALAGQPVQMILAVLANGSAEGDQAVWVNPRIVKP